MKNIYRLIIGSPGNNEIFFSRQDEDRYLDYARIYKDRFLIKVLAYSLKKDCANLLLFDNNDLRDRYSRHLREAYEYYLKLKNEEVGIRLVFKLVPVEDQDEFLRLMRFLHSEGRHSLKSYLDYTRYVEDRLLDISLVINSFTASSRDSKELFIGELTSEGVYTDNLQFKGDEIFKRDKVIKRRERAQDFLSDFLTENALDREDFLKNGYAEEKRLLISRFREETDLSFRDIGYVLGISHTTVIRIYRDLN